MKYLIAAVTFVTLIYSCKEETKPKEGIVFFNDFENIIGWGNSPTIMKRQAHSGVYSSVIDTIQPYSHTLQLKRFQISQKPVKKATISAWLMLEGNTSDAKMVLNISSDTNPTLYWNGIVIKDSIPEINKWKQVKAEFDLSKVEGDNPYNIFTAYIWNTGKGKVYVDDLEVTFID